MKNSISLLLSLLPAEWLRKALFYKPEICSVHIVTFDDMNKMAEAIHDFEAQRVLARDIH